MRNIESNSWPCPPQKSHHDNVWDLMILLSLPLARLHQGVKFTPVLFRAEQGDPGQLLKVTQGRDQVAAGQMPLSPVQWHFGGAALAFPGCAARGNCAKPSPDPSRSRSGMMRQVELP